MKRAIALLALIAAPAFAQQGAPANAASACQPPNPPAQVTLQLPPKPVEPACAGPNGNISKCSKKQIADFNAQVDAFNTALGPANEKLGEYVQALSSYQLGATKYANCEINRVNALVR